MTLAHLGSVFFADESHFNLYLEDLKGLGENDWMLHD